MSGNNTKQTPTYITLPAGSDLSAKEKYFMALSSGALATAGAGASVLGVLDNDPNAAGAAGRVQIGGVALVLAGGTCTRDLGCASDAAGKAVNSAGSDRVIGTFLDTGSSGDYVRVLLGAISTAQAADSESISSAGALNPDVPTTLLTIAGTIAYTLAAGTHVGQRKYIECVAASAIPAGTVTLADADGTEPLAWVFNAVGQRIELEWRTGGWKMLRVVPAGTDTPAAASTLNPLVLMHVIAVDGTDDWILPSGTVPGQVQNFLCSTGDNIPVGTISGLFYDEDGSGDGVDLNLNAPSDMATVMWTGARWTPLQLISATIS